MQFHEWIEQTSKAVERPLWYACGIAMLGATALVFFAVVMRYGFGMGWMWIDETTRYFFIGVVFLWAGPMVRTGEHVRLDLFTARLRGTSKEVHSLLVNGVLFLVCVLILYWSIDLIKLSILLENRSDSFVFPLWPIYLIIPVGMGLHAFYSLLELLKAGSNLRRKGNLPSSGDNMEVGG